MPVGRRFKIATIAGIPFYLSTMWIVLAALITFSEYASYSQSFLVDSKNAALMISIASAGLFFGSILLHEGAHAFVARRLGLPVWGVTLSGWGGYTETPAAARGPKGEFLVSLAGPATNILLAGAFYAAHSALRASHPLAGIVAEHYGFLNLFVGVLNALPGFPLDGGRVLMAAVWKATGERNRAMRVAAKGGYVVAALIAGWGGLQIQGANEGTAIWAFFVAYILFASARQSEARVKAREALGDARVAGAMTPAPDLVPASMTLSEALDRFLRESPELAFAVVEPDGRVSGTISLDSARKVGARDPLRPVRDAMVRGATVPTLDEDTLLADAIDMLGAREGMVVRDGRPVGKLSIEDIQRWFTVQAAGPVPTTPPPRPDL